MSFSKYNTYNQAVRTPQANYNLLNVDLVQEVLTAEEQRSEQIKKYPFEYFYEDIIASQLGIDFSKILSIGDYKNIKEDAKECLDICNEFRKLSSRIVNTWLQSSLKVADYLVLHFIQGIKKDRPKTYSGLGVERARYRQLTEYIGETEKNLGAKLEALYSARNSNEHRTYKNEDGTQTLLRPDRHRTRKLVIDFYPEILDGFKKIYSKNN